MQVHQSLRQGCEMFLDIGFRGKRLQRALCLVVSAHGSSHVVCCMMLYRVLYTGSRVGCHRIRRLVNVQLFHNAHDMRAQALAEERSIQHLAGNTVAPVNPLVGDRLDLVKNQGDE